MKMGGGGVGGTHIWRQTTSVGFLVPKDTRTPQKYISKVELYSVVNHLSMSHVSLFYKVMKTVHKNYKDT